MSKLIAFSDFHLHVFEDFAKPDEDYPNDRFREHIETLQQVFDIAREHKAFILFLGDMFHKRSTPEVEVVNHAYRVFERNSDITCYLLVGNHDMDNNRYGAEHSLETFKSLPHVTVMDRYNSYQEQDFIINAVPYSEDIEEIRKNIEAYAIASEPDSYMQSILAAHLGVDQALTGRGNHRLAGAFSVADMMPDSFDHVLLGHYHKRQTLGTEQNVHYVGNTIQTSFSDEGQPKGVMIVDSKTGTCEFEEIPNREFHTVTEVGEDTQELIKNHFVRFQLEADQARELETMTDEDTNIRVEVKKEYKTESRLDMDVSSDEHAFTKAFVQKFYPGVEDQAQDVLTKALYELETEE